MDIATRRERAAKQAARVEQARKSGISYCSISDCWNPTRAAEGNGLDETYCRKHADHFQRHGDHRKKSYTATQLRPYRKLAAKWIKQNMDSLVIQETLANIAQLYWKAGRTVPAISLGGMTPEQRAINAFGRLRDAEVDKVRVLIDILAVSQLCRADTERSYNPDFKSVQLAKAIHRKASGTHRKWESQSWEGGRSIVTTIDKYPPSRGRVLRHIGKQLETAGRMAINEYLLSVSEEITNK